MTRRPVVVTRRRVLVDLGRVTLGAVVLASVAAACAGDRTSGEAPSTNAGGDTAGTHGNWSRVDLDFVSAYVVARDGEVAIIDTGVAGSEGEIEAVLRELGAAWSDVGHVVLTHRHPDHVGSVAAVLGAAADAVAYAGDADIPAITAPRPITAVADGDAVMGLEVIATPGHTAGHISLLDPAGSVLFAGDALNGDGGQGVSGPNASFSDDLEAAWASARKLGERTFDTAVFGHGQPLVGEASTKVAALDGP